MRDLGRYAAAFQIAGFGPCLVRRSFLLFVSRACCRRQLTCALMTPGMFTSAAQAVVCRDDRATGRQCGHWDKTTRHEYGHILPRRGRDDPCARRRKSPTCA